MRAMTYGATKAIRGYACRAVERRRGVCAKSQSLVRADAIEAQFGELLADFSLPDDWQARIMESVANAMPQQVDAQSERRRLESKLSRLRVFYEEGDKPLADYRRERDAIRRQIDSLVVAPPAETINAGEYLQSLGAVWDAATMTERREIAMSLLTRVVCDPDLKRLVSFTPKPVFAPFFRHHAALRARHDNSFEFVRES